MELTCAVMTLKSRSKVCGMHTKSRMGLGCALMTLESKSKVCTLNDKNRMEQGWAIMTLKQEERGLCNAYKEQNGAGMSTTDPTE